MDTQKIKDDIQKIEKGLNSPIISAAQKEMLQKKLASLKSQLQDVASEAKEQVSEAVEAVNDEKKNLQSIIDKMRSGLNNKQVPESAKGALKKKIADAEQKLADIEKAEQAANKEHNVTVSSEVKEAVQAVNEVISDVSKGKKTKKAAVAKIKKASENVSKATKEREQTASTSKKKITKAIDELVELIKANKKLSVAYKGASKDSLMRDASRHALAPGKRVSKTGKVYYENRRNRVDVSKRKRYPFFDEGGQIDEGGIPNNYEDKTVVDVWNAWTPSQREHFVDDHMSELSGVNGENMPFLSKIYNCSYQEAVKMMARGSVFIMTLANHINRGEYKKGGKINQGNPQGEHYTEEADHKRSAKPVGWRFTEKFVNSRTGKRLGITSSSKPTKEQIEKYKDSGNIYQEARADHSDKNKRTKLAAGGVIGTGKNLYECFTPKGRIEVKADTTLAAQKTAAEHLKIKHSYDVTPVLVKLGDEEVVHSTAEFKKGGTTKKGKGKKQGNPQGEHYTPEADAKRHSKPVGWRWTSKYLSSAGAKMRGLTKRSKPTKADIAKYKDKTFKNGERYLYQEARADHSDNAVKSGI